MAQTGVIRSVACGLVLDATQYEVKLQTYTGFPSQLWIFEPAGDGVFFIVNVGNGKVMDIHGGARGFADIVTFERHGGDTQRWFIHADKTIVNAGSYFVVDIRDDNFAVGARIIAYTKHGGHNQRFTFQPTGTHHRTSETCNCCTCS